MNSQGKRRDHLAEKLARAEEAVHQSEERFQALVQNLSDAILILEPDGKRRYVSSASESILGYASGEMVGRSFFETLHPEDIEQVRAGFEHLVRTPHHVATMELRARHRDGSWRVIECVCQNMLDNPAIRGIVVNSRDVTERKRAEDAIRLSEERFRSIVQNILDVVVMYGPEGKAQYFSPAIERSLGYKPEELLGEHLLERVHPDDLEQTWAAFEFSLRNPDLTVPIEYRFRHKDGSWRHFESIGINLLDNPAVRAMIASSRDVTDRRRAEEGLQKERDFSMSIIQASPAFFIAVAPDGRIQLMNDSMLHAFGYKLEEVVGKFTMAILISPHAYEVSLAFFDRLVRARQPVQREVRMVAKDGRELLVDWQGRPVLRPGGDLDFLFAVGVDVTERRKREEEAIQAQKMESIGILAGGIAHDFNNILGAIVLNLSLAEAEAAGGTGDRVQGLLSEAKKASLRARGITQQLLTLSRGGLPVKKTICIADTLRDSARLALTGSSSRCLFELPEVLWPVEADEVQIGQVVNNLIMNADQAMPEGGTITVVAENATIESEEEGLRLKPGKYVKILVRDEGKGIQDEHLPKIFDPYFSTKREGGGLGLAISYSIVDKHGGAIRVATKPGVETVFSVYLPASDRGLPEARAPEKVVALSSGSILVVDDDEMLRSVVCKALEKMGYQAASCEDGAQAVEMYRRAREAGAPFDAVLMDLTIPGGMGGKEAMKRLRQIDPGIRVIVCSGYSNDPIMSNYRGFGFCGVISKPYRLEELAGTLRDVMAEPKTPVEPA